MNGLDSRHRTGGIRTSGCAKQSKGFCEVSCAGQADFGVTRKMMSDVNIL